MNLALTDNIIEAYRARLSPEDYNRLVFFRGIWDIQARIAEQAAGSLAYATPEADTLESNYWQGEPILLRHPAAVDIDLYAAALEEYAVYLSEKAGFKSTVATALAGFDWPGLIELVDGNKLGQDPAAFIDDCTEQLIQQLDDEELLGALRIVLVLALRPILEPLAGQIMQALQLSEENTRHEKPLHCPVCGGSAAAARVGSTPSGASNGKMLYCSVCGTTWEFERIRCAHCGTHNQGKLHYFHTGDDSAHRIYLCDDCSGYTRTVFAEELNLPFCFEVEDVVMARLDNLAQDERFKR